MSGKKLYLVGGAIAVAVVGITATAAVTLGGSKAQSPSAAPTATASHSYEAYDASYLPILATADDWAAAVKDVTDTFAECPAHLEANVCGQEAENAVQMLDLIRDEAQDQNLPHVTAALNTGIEAIGLEVGLCQGDSTKLGADDMTKCLNASSEIGILSTNVSVAWHQDRE